MAIVAIVGSGFMDAQIAGHTLQKEKILTSAGEFIYFRLMHDRPCYVIFRHGFPYQYLPHQIPYLLQAEVLERLHCEALLLTSSVGVLTPELPLFQPMLLSDFIMLDNRLPNGAPCTLASEKKLMHLVFQEGPFSSDLNEQIKKKCHDENLLIPEVIYAHFGGPRTKTKSENRLFAQMGAQVNSMTLGPEIVLANELGIPTSAIVVGHKYSCALSTHLNKIELKDSLQQSRNILENWIYWFFQSIEITEFGNLLYQIK